MSSDNYQRLKTQKTLELKKKQTQKLAQDPVSH